MRWPGSLASQHHVDLLTLRRNELTQLATSVVALVRSNRQRGNNMVAADPRADKVGMHTWKAVWSQRDIEFFSGLSWRQAAATGLCQ